MQAPQPTSPASTAAALFGIVGVVVAQFAWVKPSNFGGYDEWVILSLVAQGITDIPHANRPFELLWSLPTRLGPPSLWSYHALHTAYLAGEGCLAFLLWRRLLPGAPMLAFLAGVFTACWAPLDYQRLNVVQPYAGYAFVAQLAALLLAEAWLRERPALLWLGALLAFLNIRAYEGSAALLLGAPLCLAFSRTRPRRPLAFIAVWEGVVLLALALAAAPLLAPRGLAYQQQLLGGLDPNPLRVAERLAEQYRYHLWPLLTTPAAELRVWAVPIALAAFGLAYVWSARGAGDVVPSRRVAARLIPFGLVLAGLGYGVLVLSTGLFEASRTQFFSAPGIGLFLAASLALLASLVPPRMQATLLLVLASFVVAVGTARTLALQRFWDGVSVHDEQTRLLRGLARMAPRLKPNTFVILVDEASVFLTSGSFRHALLYLYPGEATGHAWGKWELGYPARWTADGVVSEPWPVLQRSWGVSVSRHRFDEMLVVRQPAAGELQLLDDWPAGLLPPLPPLARYDPRSRIVDGPRPPQRRILGTLP